MTHSRLRLIIIPLLVYASLLFADALDDANEYFLTGQYQKAIPAYEQALKTSSDKAEIYYNLAVCNEKLGNLERALNYYESAGSTRDAAAQAARLSAEIKKRKISRLKGEAQSAFDAMNYGVARSKADEIIKLDPENQWAQGLIESITSQNLSPEIDTSTTVLTPETTSKTVDSRPEVGTLSTSKTEPASPLLIILASLAVIVLVLGAFFLGRALKRDTAERIISSMVKLVPAGMLSLKLKKDLILLFFEEGKVIKAVVEGENGETAEGRKAVEMILRRRITYLDKGYGPWNDFANLVVELYRRAENGGLNRTEKNDKDRKSMT
ncbi:tetratricopeptide repeat protein [bacterium]|nr:tetratricopeptide repeat protein [bacterium]